MIPNVTFAEASSVAPSIPAQAEGIEILASFSVPNAIGAADDMGTAEDAYQVAPDLTIAAAENKWTPALDKRLSVLAAKYALERATDEENRELDRLKLLRRRLKHPLSTDEILFQYRRRQKEAILLKQLQEYVEFLNAPRRSKA